MDPYAGFAARYDLSFDSSAEQDQQVGEFFRQLFTHHRVHTVLDCACGTGRHLPVFHSLGCQVWGSDVSEAMLEQARQNLARWGLDIPLGQVDFRALPGQFSQQFDAVVCLAAITFMHNKAEFLQAYRSMAQVLRPQGVLVLTAMPVERQWREKPRFILNSSNRKLTRLFVIDYLAHVARFNILDILPCDEAGVLKVWSVELHPFLQSDQEALLKSAGFYCVDFYENFVFKPYDRETSNSIVAVANLEQIKYDE